MPRPHNLPILDPRPSPFSPTADVKHVTIAGRIIELRLYRNRDGCEIWATSRPKRGEATQHPGASNAFARAF